MTPKIKSLLLGVDLGWKQAESGGHTHGSKLENQQTEALGRLTIFDHNLRVDTLSSMLDSGTEVLQWLTDHPKASVSLGYWTVQINSPNFEDVDFEKHDWPFDLNGGVETFEKTKCGPGWFCAWGLG